MPSAKCQLPNSNLQNADLPNDNCQMPICQMPTAKCQLPKNNCPMTTTKWQLPNDNCKMTICKMPSAKCQLPILICKMSICQMTICQMTICQMPICQMPYAKCQLPSDNCQMPICQMTTAQWQLPNDNCLMRLSQITMSQIIIGQYEKSKIPYKSWLANEAITSCPKTHRCRQLRYSCEAKDFIHLWNEMRWNFIKTKSEGPRKLFLNTVNFRSGSGRNLPNFHPFFMARTKVNEIQPTFDEFLKSL